jgi:mevalonate kinase
MKDQYFYGHGKLLLTSEYFVLEGAEALALPTTVGQSLKVKTRPSYQPVLNWKSLDHLGNIWFESDYDFWHFRPIKNQENETQKFISNLLIQVRKQNPHFLRDDVDVFVETKIEFPLEWGLGSSSTLLYNVAQWAYVSPFELLKNTLGGSGYDIACAQANGPILFSLKEGKPQWENVIFNPSFKDYLFFLYLGKKQSSFQEIKKFHMMKIPNKQSIVKELSLLTSELLNTSSLKVFDELLIQHENLLSCSLGYPIIKSHFQDFWGQIKSLGAWGGDFCLVTSEKSYLETKDYFASKGFDTLIPYSEIIRKQLD